MIAWCKVVKVKLESFHTHLDDEWISVGRSTQFPHLPLKHRFVAQFLWNEIILWCIYVLCAKCSSCDICIKYFLSNFPTVAIMLSLVMRLNIDI